MTDPAAQLARNVVSRLKFRHLALLDSVARLRTLSRVAEELRLTQPAITRAVQEIEDIFGVPLFERSNRGLNATAAGRVVLAQARALLHDVEATTRELSAIGAGLHGRLRLGVIPHLPTALLEAALGELMAQAPRMAVMVREATTDELIASLRGHELDCAIGRPTYAAGEVQITQQPLYRQTPCVLVSRKVKARLAGRRLTLGDLVGLDWILPPPSTPIRRSVEAMFASIGLPTPVPLLETYSLKSIAAALRSQPGLAAILSSDIGAELAAGGAGALLPCDMQWDLPPLSLLLRSGPEVPRVPGTLVEAIRQAAAVLADGGTMLRQ